MSATGREKPARIRKEPASRISIIGRTLGEIPPVNSISAEAIAVLSSFNVWPPKKIPSSKPPFSINDRHWIN